VLMRKPRWTVSGMGDEPKYTSLESGCAPSRAARASSGIALPACAVRRSSRASGWPVPLPPPYQAR
jgi:hypothetical protein